MLLAGEDVERIERQDERVCRVVRAFNASIRGLLTRVSVSKMNDHIEFPRVIGIGRFRWHFCPGLVW